MRNSRTFHLFVQCNSTLDDSHAIEISKIDFIFFFFPFKIINLIWIMNREFTINLLEFNIVSKSVFVQFFTAYATSFYYVYILFNVSHIILNVNQCFFHTWILLDSFFCYYCCCCENRQIEQANSCITNTIEKESYLLSNVQRFCRDACDGSISFFSPSSSSSLKTESKLWHPLFIWIVNYGSFFFFCHLFDNNILSRLLSHNSTFNLYTYSISIPNGFEVIAHIFV